MYKFSFALLFLQTALLDLAWAHSNESQCFVRGECKDSPGMGVHHSPDEETCLNFCKNQTKCLWFTFYPDSEACHMLETCNRLDNTECDGCLSGERYCTSAECWVTGYCQGNVSHVHENVYKKEDCLGLCRSNPVCHWFTHFESSCFLMDSCNTLDESCSTCISGQHSCHEPPGFTKLLVYGGYVEGGTTADVEIIDLTSAETACQKLNDFPHSAVAGIGYVNRKNKPYICGGRNADDTAFYSQCYFYENNAWKSAANMKRGLAAAAAVPFHVNSESDWFVTGGNDGGGIIDAISILTDSHWEDFLSPLPIKVSGHCIVQYNSTMIMSIGGYYPGSNQVFFFNSMTNTWSEGPNLIRNRFEPSCSKVKVHPHKEIYSIVVVGGMDNTTLLSSVEILDFQSNSWKMGPEFPFPFRRATAVTDNAGQMIVVGPFSDKLFKLYYNGESGYWDELPQRLKIARQIPVAFLIPDEVAECS